MIEADPFLQKPCLLQRHQSNIHPIQSVHNVPIATAHSNFSFTTPSPSTMVSPSLPLFIALFLATTATAHDGATTVGISSPSTCLSVQDCENGFYCREFERNLRFESRYGATRARCAPRLSVGMECRPDDLFACKYGLYCPRSTTALPRCKTLPVRGQVCDSNIPFACRPGLRCTRAGICADTSATGKVGAPCVSDFSCALDRGISCDLITSKCVKRKPVGAKCSADISFNRASTQTRSQDCEGYCRPNKQQFSRTGICRPRRGIGQTCTMDAECWNPRLFPTYWEDPRRCNHGKCVKESMLRKRLGASCWKGFDRCDDRRALTCLWATKLRRTVCQHRSEQRGYCQPGNALSRCLSLGPDGNPLECRAARGDVGFLVAPPADRRHFVCLQKSIPAVLGGPCINDVDACPKGANCRRIPYYRFSNVRRVRSVGHFACMKLLKKGANCSVNKLASMCGDGLVCKAGRCVQGQIRFRGPFIRAGLYSDCSKELPCAPGLICSNENGGPFCEFVMKRVGLGDICGFAIKKECTSGLICGGPGPVRRCVKSPIPLRPIQ